MIRKEWTRDDSFNSIFELGEREFEVVDIIDTPDGVSVNQYRVSLDEEDEEEIIIIIDAFGYDSIEDVRRMHGSNANRVIAECIAKVRANEEEILDKEGEVAKWLRGMDNNLKLAI